MNKLRNNLFVYEDTCRVYVIKHEDSAVLIDFGSGGILQGLPQLGIQKIDMVIHTNHHRDVCGGDHLLGSDTVIAVAEEERFLFENAEHFWQKKRVYVNYRADMIDFTITKSIAVRGVEDGELIRWAGNTFQVMSTPGDSMGAISIIWDNGDEKIVFCGDLISAPGKVHNIYSFQWEYMPDNLFAEWTDSLKKLMNISFDLLCPSHGEAMDNGKDGITLLLSRISSLLLMMNPVRIPYPKGTLYRILPHLIYVDKTSYLIVSENGHGIMIDYGYVDYDKIVKLKDDFGLKKIDAIIFTHYHDDHISRAAEIQYHPWTSHELFRDVEIWNLDQVADILKHPKRYNLPCLFPSNMDSDRVFKSGDHVQWNEYNLYFYHYPGQTYYAMGIFAEIDGQRVLFTGDNIWPLVNGGLVTPVIFRNIADPEGFVRAAREMKALHPTLLATGHYGAVSVDGSTMDSYIRWSEEFKKQIYEMIHQDCPMYGIDCKWAYFYPYITESVPGEDIEIWLRVKNYGSDPTDFIARLIMPEGISCDHGTRKISVEGHSNAEVSFTLRLSEQLQTGRRYVVTAEINRNAMKCGEVTECMVETKNRREFL